MAPLSKLAGMSLLASAAFAAPTHHGQGHGAHHAKRGGTFVSGGVLYSTSTATYTIYETPTTFSEPTISTPLVSSTVDTPVYAPTTSSTVDTPVYTPATIDLSTVFTPPSWPTPSVSTPAVSTPAVSTPVVSTPAVSTPVVSTPAVSTPAYITPSASSTTSSAAATQTSSDSGGILGGIVHWFQDAQLTFYETNGVTSCDETVDGNTQSIIAMSSSQMGTQSNNNQYCGKMVEIEYEGKTAQAKVVDKCAGCVSSIPVMFFMFCSRILSWQNCQIANTLQQTGTSIDLSKAVFEKFASFSVGRLHNAKWRFID